MKTLRLLPVVLSLLLLGAHFYRGGNLVLTGLCGAVLFLLFLRRTWVPVIFQVLLGLGAIEWLRTLYMLAAMRIAWNQPWTRMALILLAVALFTALSGLVFRHSQLRDYYRPPRD